MFSLHRSRIIPLVASALFAATTLPLYGVDESSQAQKSVTTKTSSKAPSSKASGSAVPRNSTSSRSGASGASSTQTPDGPPAPAVVPAPQQAAEVVSDSRKPPRGTLGNTYSRVTHPVPADKHPRLAMLAVRDNSRHPVITVQNMSGLRLKSGVWLFESSRPLDPGVSQVVRVEAREQMVDVAPYTTRFVRLIPGRIVYLDFSNPAED